MNRREFLQSLLALGGSIAIPLEAIATAPDTVIDQAWQMAIKQPVTFYANEYGALSTAAVETYASTRAVLLDFEEIGDREALVAFANDEWQVADLLEQAMADDQELDDDDVEIVHDDWQVWVESADDSTIAYLINRVNKWINDTPGEQDWERADLSGYSGRGDALRYFRDEFEYYEEFNVVVVEGDCPGSSYFAAELRMDVDEANELAKALDIPIRFAWQG